MASILSTNKEPWSGTPQAPAFISSLGPSTLFGVILSTGTECPAIPLNKRDYIFLLFCPHIEWPVHPKLSPVYQRTMKRGHSECNWSYQEVLVQLEISFTQLSTGQSTLSIVVCVRSVQYACSICGLR